MKYSVIIPVYKAEKTLERCLDSLIKHQRDDVELLVINDGSPDKSGDICRKYAEKHPCIRYFEKENGGVSSARNLGLEKATGEYLLFVDSDDYVSDDYFAVIDQAISEKAPDMIIFGYRNFGGNDSAWTLGDYFSSGECDTAGKAADAMRKYLFSPQCSKVLKREIIRKNALKYDDSLSIGEDQTFLFSYAMHMNSILSIGKCLYNVSVENADSLSRRRRDYLTEQLLHSSLQMFGLLEKSELSARAKRIYGKALAWMHYRSAYSCCKELLKYELSPRERRKKIRSICKAFCKAKIKAGDIKCLAIALPVKLKMARAIDRLIKMHVGEVKQ